MFQILTTATLKHAKEYRKVTASISSPEVCKVSFDKVTLIFSIEPKILIF